MKNLKFFTILLICYILISCKKDNNNNTTTESKVNIYKDIPNKGDGLVADVYNVETQYKTYFYGSFNDKGIPTDIKSIVLESKYSDTLYNYILDENNKIYLAYPSMKNGIKLNNITKITEDTSLFTMNFYDYNWSNQTAIFVESITMDITKEVDITRLAGGEDPSFDILGFEQKRKELDTWLDERLTWVNEKYAGIMNSICSSSFGVFCGSSTQGLGGALEDLNKWIKEKTDNGVIISVNDFLQSPTSDGYEPKENEYTPPSPTSNANTIPAPQIPHNQPPTCLITKPSEGDKIPASENINVTILATDIDGYILSVTIYLDGIKQVATRIPGTSAFFNFTIPANSLSKGYHYVFASAIDDKYKTRISPNSIHFYIENADSSTVTDIDGNIYHTVKIGTQTWLVENLKTTRYNDGTNIPNITVDSTWYNYGNGTIGGYPDVQKAAWCYYNNNASNNIPHGKLYNWHAVNTNKIAPSGWHVPTLDEWLKLINFLGEGNTGFVAMDTIADRKMKATTLWQGFNADGNNSSNFTAYPSAVRNNHGNFDGLGYYCEWWASTQSINNSSYAWSVGINSDVHITQGSKTPGFSIRCIKD